MSKYIEIFHRKITTILCTLKKPKHTLTFYVQNIFIRLTIHNLMKIKVKLNTFCTYDKS